MTELRIVSFLPSATEMVCALGLADHLVGITHECDYPPEIRTKPIVVRDALPLAGLSLREVDAAVSARIRSGKPLRSGRTPFAGIGAHSDSDPKPLPGLRTVWQ